MKELNRTSNKIWFMWFQGKNKMPEIVELCYKSWLKYNNNWEIIFIDKYNISNYFDGQEFELIQNGEIPIAAKSDIIRINILKKYGGVWVDATCYCAKPLNDWLDKYMLTGFFAFSTPGRDRMISSWFLSTHVNNPLVNTYCEAVNDFWNQNPKMKLFHWKESYILKKTGINWLLSHKPNLWLSSFFTQKLKRYPYFWFHYNFEKIYKKDIEFKEVWDQTPKISAEGPHLIQKFGLDKPISIKLQKILKMNTIPVFKLSWKTQYTRTCKSDLYQYLKEKIELL